MTDSIWIDARHVKLRSYSSVSRKGGSIVKLELEIADPMALGHLLRDCAAFNTPPSAQPPARRRSIPLLPPPDHGD